MIGVAPQDLSPTGDDTVGVRAHAIDPIDAIPAVAAIVAHFRAARCDADAPSRSVVDLLAQSAAVFLARWPGLSSVPQLAPLAFARAFGSWGRSFELAAALVGPAACAIDPEIELIASGEKPACLKESVPSAVVADLAAAYRAMGLAAEGVDRHGHDARGLHCEGEAYTLLAVARGEAELAEVVAAQRAHVAGKPAPVARMGRSMGYPSCCARAFEGQATRRDNADNERLTFRRAPEEAMPPALNRIGRLRLISHHLCSPGCAASLAIAESVLAKVAAVDADAADRILAILAAPVLLLDVDRRIELQGAWRGDGFEVSAMAALDDAALPIPSESAARIYVEAGRVTFVDRAGVRADIVADRPLLITPGTPLAPAALAAIGGPLLPVAAAGLLPLARASSVTTGAEAPKPRASASPTGSLPSLPPAIRAGVRVVGYRIMSSRTEGGAHVLALATAVHRFELRVRPRSAASEDAVVCGSWALDVPSPAELPEPARAAVLVIARVLAL